jgi:hypothetical protein
MAPVKSLPTPKQINADAWGKLSNTYQNWIDTDQSSVTIEYGLYLSLRAKRSNPSACEIASSLHSSQ